jgi:pilus assembly protein Flp/PilA
MERPDDTGASAVEYGLLLAAITAVIVAAVFLWGSAVENLFSTSGTTLQNCIDSTSC